MVEYPLNIQDMTLEERQQVERKLMESIKDRCKKNPELLEDPYIITKLEDLLDDLVSLEKMVGRIK